MTLSCTLSDLMLKCFQILLHLKRMIYFQTIYRSKRDEMASAPVVDRASDGDDDDGMEVMVINGRTLSVKANLSSKSKLNIYSQNYKLGKPEYKIRVLDENHTVLRKFISTVDLEGKTSLGTGTSKKRAEVAASRKYCNNIFLGGGKSLLLGKEVSTSKAKVPSNKKLKDKIKMERFLEKKRAAAAAAAGEADHETPEDTVLPDEVPVPESDASLTLAVPDVSLTLAMPLEFDLERSGGADDTEIIQLGYAFGEKSGGSFILPRGKIDPFCAKVHKIKVLGNTMKRENVEVKTETMFEAGMKFIKFIKDVSSGRSVYLVCHGNDMKTLLINMATVGIDKEIVENIVGCINSLEVMNDDEQFDNKSKSLSSLKKSKNLAEEILGSNISREELSNTAHDAVYDSLLLGRVWAKYLAAWSPEPESIIVDNYMDPGANLIRDAQSFISKIGDKRRRKVKPVKDYGVLNFNGWL